MLSHANTLECSSRLCWIVHRILKFLDVLSEKKLCIILPILIAFSWLFHNNNNNNNSNNIFFSSSSSIFAYCMLLTHRNSWKHVWVYMTCIKWLIKQVSNNKLTVKKMLKYKRYIYCLSNIYAVQEVSCHPSIPSRLICCSRIQFVMVHNIVLFVRKPGRWMLTRCCLAGFASPSERCRPGKITAGVY